MNNSQIKITALSISDLVKLLKRSGCRAISEETVREDVANSAPVNPDGTFNLINYAARLSKESTEDAAN